MTNTAKTILYLTASGGIILIAVASRPSSGTDILIKVLLPAALLFYAVYRVPQYNYPTKSGKNWYRVSDSAPGSIVPLPSTWQGWLTDAASVIFITAVCWGVYQHALASIDGELAIRPILLELAPCVVVMVVNLWIRNHYCDAEV